MTAGQAFDQLMKDMTEHVKNINELLQVLKPDRKHQKRVDQLMKQWEDVYKSADFMGTFISPIQALEVRYPKFFTPDVKAKWDFWREYLHEEFGIQIKSRREIMSLKLLQDLSNSDPEEAIRILEYAMGTGYPRFFKINTKKASGQPEIADMPDWNEVALTHKS